MKSTTQSIILIASTALVLAGLAVDSASRDAGSDSTLPRLEAPAPQFVEVAQPAPVATGAEPTAAAIETALQPPLAVPIG